MSGKTPLLGLSLEELKQVVLAYKLPAFTAKQIADWLYKKQVRSIMDMTNISIKAREVLSEDYEVGVKEPAHISVSSDGTEKYLFPVGDGSKFIEAVYIPEKDRATLCISSQIGCQMNCLFCATGKQGFSGNLTTAEILNQVQSINHTEKLTNVVFMGMGEPLNNKDVVLKAISIMTSDYGYAWSPKRITVSTVGIIPALQDFLEKTTCNLAVSVHAAGEVERRELIPAEKAFPVQQVFSILRKYDWSHQRKLSVEYTLFNDLNDTEACAKQLHSLIHGMNCHVNLIPYHTIPDVGLTPTPMKKIEQFQAWLTKKGLNVTVRRSRGQDIEAACGMLSKTRNS